MAEGSADVMIAGAAAMEQAGIPAGDPVMLVGHSLGGIAAMALASNSSFESRYNVRSVVTAGSPVARFEPAGIASVLSLENSTDIVWAADGAPNPDRANWITVTHDLRASEDPLDRAAAASFVGSHEPATYVRTAGEFDATAAPSALAWRDANAMFLADETSVSVRTTYAITRGTEAATIPSVADHR
jgi:pimeloyl-ACP methyl ester carboxylesterase